MRPWRVSGAARAWYATPSPPGARPERSEDGRVQTQPDAVRHDDDRHRRQHRVRHLPHAGDDRARRGLAVADRGGLGGGRPDHAGRRPHLLGSRGAAAGGGRPIRLPDTRVRRPGRVPLRLGVLRRGQRRRSRRAQRRVRHVPRVLRPARPGRLEGGRHRRPAPAERRQRRRREGRRDLLERLHGAEAAGPRGPGRRRAGARVRRTRRTSRCRSPPRRAASGARWRSAMVGVLWSYGGWQHATYASARGQEPPADAAPRDDDRRGRRSPRSTCWSTWPTCSC